MSPDSQHTPRLRVSTKPTTNVPGSSLGPLRISTVAVLGGHTGSTALPSSPALNLPKLGWPWQPHHVILLVVLQASSAPAGSNSNASFALSRYPAPLIIKTDLVPVPGASALQLHSPAGKAPPRQPVFKLFEALMQRTHELDGGSTRQKLISRK